MNAMAIFMMLFTLVTVCGGFIWAIVRLQVISTRQTKEENDK